MLEQDEHSGANSADAPEDLILALLDGDMKGAELEAFETVLAQSPELSADMRVYQGITATLLATGDDFRIHTGNVSVLDAVMAQIQKDNVVPFQVSDEQERQIEEDLKSIGLAFAGTVPKINLKTAVMEKIRPQQKDTIDNIVPLRARPQLQKQLKNKPERSVLLYVSLAAAACLVLMFGIYNTDLFVGENAISNNMASNQIKPFNPTPDKNLVSKSDLEKIAIKAVPRPIFSNDIEAGDASGNPKLSQTVYGTISLDSVMDKKRKASLDTKEGIDALAELKTWSSLTPEQARRLLEKGGLSAAAILGVAQFLPPGEAAALLEEQAKANPENPYLHYSLASIYAGMGQGTDAQTHLAALERQDPGNAMNPFLEAAVMREHGNDSMSLALLLESAQSETANTYALESANYRSEALVARGFDPVVADYLASIGAGTSEYNQIMNMTNDFVEYGQEFENAQDYESALGVYESLNQFGINLGVNADFANEQLAGLDTQNAALTAIQGVVEILQNPVSVDVLESGYDVFNQGLQQMGTFFADFNAIMNTAMTNELTGYVESIMESGDLDFMSGLQNNKQ